MPVNVDFVGSPLFLKKTSSLALSNLNSGIIVRFPILILGESVISKILVPGAATTAFLLSKYSPRSVIPKVLDGSTLKYNAEPHQLLELPPSGFTD